MADKVNRNPRINSLDLLRGVAVLGILLMNITSFSHIGTGYLNPTVGAGVEGINGWIHGFNWLFSHTRFMSIFTILFGAGMLLFASRMEAKNLSVNKFQYRRLFWLLLFGFIHAYCLWMGDILVAYAISGSLVFLVRNKSDRFLKILGSMLFCIPILLTMSSYYGMPLSELEAIVKFWDPTQAEIDKEIATMTGPYFGQFGIRMKGAITLQTIVFFFEIFWRASSMMILGMLLYRWEVLSSKRSNSYYKKMTLIGLCIGLLISSFGLFKNYENNWSGVYSFNIGGLYTYVSSLLVALGYIGLVMLWAKSDLWKSFKMRLQAVGRMAFTNYIFMSVFCGLIFNGHGLGLFGQLDRLEQLGIVLLNWLIMLFISPIILKRFGQGPLEKLWRKLTYWGA